MNVPVTADERTLLAAHALRAALEAMREAPGISWASPIVGAAQKVPSRVIDTACITGGGEQVVYNPEWFLSLTPAQRVGLLGHEAFHVVFHHVGRRDDRDPERWNDATDLSLNHMLTICGVELPPGGLYDDKYGWLAPEDVYDLREAQGHPPSGQPGCLRPDLEPQPMPAGLDLTGLPLPGNGHGRPQPPTPTPSAPQPQPQAGQPAAAASQAPGADDDGDDDGAGGTGDDDGADSGDDAGGGGSAGAGAGQITQGGDQADGAAGQDGGAGQPGAAGQPGNGTATGEGTAPGEAGQPDGNGQAAAQATAGDGEPDQTAEEIMAAAMQAAMDAAVAQAAVLLREAFGNQEGGEGHGPGVASGLVLADGTTLLDVARVDPGDHDWTAELFARLGQHRGRGWSWLRPSRRAHGLDVYLPGEGQALPNVTFALDGSVSIGERRYFRFVSEGREILEALGYSCRVLVCDYAVRWDGVLESVDDLPPFPNGGDTAFAPVFDRVEDDPTCGGLCAPPDVLVYFTDLDVAEVGWGRWKADPPPYEVLWAVVDFNERTLRSAPFGETIAVRGEGMR